MKKPAIIAPKELLNAYAQGVFPMGEEDGSIAWYTADPRGILPLEGFHVPGTLRQMVKQQRFTVRINADFEAVMRQCMATRPISWINEPLIATYLQLHKLGHAHSVQCWQNGRVVGGLYGVSLGGAFFGESMFHVVRDASKVALVHLVERLREKGFSLLDTQATTTHLVRFGCIEIPAQQYLALLRVAITQQRSFI